MPNLKTRELANVNEFSEMYDPVSLQDGGKD
jgi:hypothetical protein